MNRVRDWLRLRASVARAWLRFRANPSRLRSSLTNAHGGDRPRFQPGKWMQTLVEIYGRLSGGAPGVRGPSQQPWRQVPVIDVFPGRRRTTPAAMYVRGFLVLILLVEAFLIQDQYRDRVAADQSIEDTGAEVQAVKVEVSAKEQVFEALQAQLDQLVLLQNKPAETQHEESAIAKQVDWATALSALFGLRVEGVTLQAVSDRPEGQVEVVLDGTATGVAAMAEFQTRLRQGDHPFDLQTIDWERSGETLTFTVVIKLMSEESTGGEG